MTFFTTLCPKGLRLSKEAARKREAFDSTNYHFEHLHRLRRFQTPGFIPNVFTVSRFLSISTNLNALIQGKQLHALIVKKNVTMDVAATNSLLNMYLKCKNLDDAERVFDEMTDRDLYSLNIMVSGYALNGWMEKAVDLFDRMPQRNTVSWNSMINALRGQGYEDEALSLFTRMRREGEVPNGFTFVEVLKPCACLQLSGFGVGVHCCVLKSAWMKNVLVRCSLMDMYAKCGDMISTRKIFSEKSVCGVVSSSILVTGYARNGMVTEAEEIFNGMAEKNVVSWNVMIMGFVQNGRLDRAFRLLVEMVDVGMKPDCFTVTSLLSGCSMPQYATCGKSLHGYVLKAGFHSDTSITNSMISMYDTHGNASDARIVFDTMPLHDVISWTAMVAAYISDANTEDARHVFESMPYKNVISWNTMMSGYLQKPNSPCTVEDLSHSLEDGLTFFYEMERSSKPDHFTYNCALTACAGVGALERARAIHCKALKRGYESDLGVGNALITVYGKCGSLTEAENAFNFMATLDLISWNTMLAGYSQNGRGNAALDLYEKMQESGIEPNHVTFISLLSACSYMGYVEKGREFFDKMERMHGITPCKEHYTCMVDLLSRAGLLDDAESVFDGMKVDPDAALWGALLGGCKIHGDYEIARRAADRIFQLEPNNVSAHVALAESYAAAGMWDDVSRVRTVMKEKRLLKEPGYSWIEIKNQKYMFLSGDFRLTEKDLIYATLYILYSDMIKEGYVQELEPLAMSVV